MSEQPLGSIRNSRSPEQIAHMKNTIGRGICPFCQIDHSINKMIKSGQHWNIWPNPFPYPNLRVHLVFATTRHLTKLDELGPTWPELLEHSIWAQQEFKVAGGGITMRFGDFEHNAASIAHAHAHLMVPDKTGPAFVQLHKLVPGADLAEQQSRLIRAFTSL